MKKHNWRVTVLLLALMALNLPALAQEKIEEKAAVEPASAVKEEPKPYFSAAAAGLSQYIFRGYEQSKNSIVI